MTKLLEPIDATYIYIPGKHFQKGIRYTDCFESSLLRYLHIIFEKNNTINLILLHKYRADPKLIDFFTKYNHIFPENKYYTTKKGMEERKEWCILLNDNKTFDFVHSGTQSSYELKSCLKNIFIFLDIFIPLYRFKHPIHTKIEYDVECSIYPKCKGKQILTTDTIRISSTHTWVLTQFFEIISTKRITGHSEIIR